MKSYGFLKRTQYVMMENVSCFHSERKMEAEGFEIDAVC